MKFNWLAALLLALAVADAGARGTVGQVVGTVKETNRADAVAQQRIDELAAETRKMLQAYRHAIIRRQQLTVYNRELARIIAEQERRVAALQRQIESLSGLRASMESLMIRMIDHLARFVKADLPFLLAERNKRIASLRAAMANPALTLADRFRKVLAAYLAEARYGRTLGTYRGELEWGGTERLVEFLRVGRVMLFYITPDNARVGYWDRGAGTWRPLPADYRDAIRRGIRVAKDLAAPQLIEIAVPAPGSGQPRQTAQPGSGAGRPAEANGEGGS